MTIKNNSLFKQQAFFAGSWHDADSAEDIEVTNPANGNVLGKVPVLSGAQIDNAIEAAYEAQVGWRELSAKTRSEILNDWFVLITEHADTLAKIMTLEQGKPLAEAKAEVNYAAAYVQWFAEEAKRIYGDTIPGHLADKRIVVLKQPVGVVAAITPWNFPLAMITRKCAPALAAGCTFLVKPAMETPFSALALAELAEQAGIPGGVFNELTGNADQIGKQFCENYKVRKLSFTGSTEVGKTLMRQCVDDVKKVSMELGGNAPFIVFDDADIEQAVAGAITSKYRNAGQTCVCADRFFVQENIYTEFIERLAQEVAKLRIGNGLDDGVQVGPLISAKAVNNVRDRLRQAIDAGAHIVTGGDISEYGETFFTPTILANVNPDMAVFSEENFGPIAAVVSFQDEADVLRLANDSRYGLSGYFFSNDISRIWRVAEKLEVGIVGVNTGLISTEVAPFGGVKESGKGREGSKYGIDDYVEIKYICMQIQQSED